MSILVDLIMPGLIPDASVGASGGHGGESLAVMHISEVETLRGRVAIIGVERRVSIGWRRRGYG